jgi:hypothetical protein
MRIDSRLYRRLLWLAFAAMIFAALAPTVSKLLSTAIGTTWIEVCSVEGVKRIAVASSDAETSQQAGHTDKHCGYCLLWQQTPFAATTTLEWDTSSAIPYRLSLRSSTSLLVQRFTRRAHPTRAPPSMSV